VPGPDAEMATVVQEGPAGPPPVVEEEEIAPPPPPPPPRRPLLWPWLLLLLVLVAGGLLALWLLTRDNDHKGTATDVVVPNVVGQKQGAAVRRLDRAGLTSRILSRPSKVAAGTVFQEQPDPGSRVARGSVIALSVSSAATVSVPDVVGARVAAAVRVLRARGLVVETASVASPKEAGLVLGQSPRAGAQVAKGSTEVIRVSRGLVTVPDLTGQPRADAIAALRGAGLVPQAFTVPSSQPKGTVVAQLPRAGRRVPQGSKVRINLSNGRSTGGGVAPPPQAPPPPPPPPPPPATKLDVPDVTGQSQQAAQRQLNSAGFKARVVYVPSDEPVGTVVTQSPVGGTSARRGTRVQLNASLGPDSGPQQSVPDVLGLDPRAATARLTAAGFKVQRLTQNVSVSSQNGVVVDEQPAGAKSVPAGSAVTIYVGRLTG
jgi:eukaryotic-like serine/threonine-protein kinase